MVSDSEVFKAWQDGFVNKDSSRLAEFFTDDFQLIRPAGSFDLPGRTRTKQETLDWAASGGSPTRIDNFELLYENDDVPAIVHGANSDGSTVVALYTKRDGKISECRIVRQMA